MPKPKQKKVTVSWSVSDASFARLQQCARGWSCKSVPEYIKRLVQTKLGEVDILPDAELSPKPKASSKVLK